MISPSNDMNGLINSDPFCIEALHSTEEISTIVTVHHKLRMVDSIKSCIEVEKHDNSGFMFIRCYYEIINNPDK